jgi:hypothetical protein
MPVEETTRAMVTDGCLERSTRYDDGIAIQVATLPRQHTCERNGQRLTVPARTVADCLRHYVPQISIPIADAAVRSGQADRAVVEDILRWQEGWPYAGRGRSSAKLIDARRESWLESVSAVALWECSLDLPEPQVEVRTRAGRFVARVDFLWRDGGTVGEADGAAKYALPDQSEPGDAAAGDLATERAEAAVRAVRREKEREDELRSLGLEVVRWSTQDILRRPAQVAARVKAAQRRGDLSRFEGVLLATPRL